MNIRVEEGANIMRVTIARWKIIWTLWIPVCAIVGYLLIASIVKNGGISSTSVIGLSLTGISLTITIIVLRSLILSEHEIRNRFIAKLSTVTLDLQNGKYVKSLQKFVLYHDCKDIPSPIMIDVEQANLVVDANVSRPILEFKYNSHCVKLRKSGIVIRQGIYLNDSKLIVNCMPSKLKHKQTNLEKYAVSRAVIART
jgi:hypothetical protein